MEIEVTNLDPWELLAALHNASRVSLTSVCLAQERGEITAEDAQQETTQWDARPVGDVPHFPDYLFGRPIKTFLRKAGDSIYLTRTDLYDRDIGAGAAARVVGGLKQKE